MAHTTDFQRQGYPLAVYNFRVKVDDALVSFAEVSGLAVESEQATYRHGLSFLEGESIQTFRFERFTRVTCRRGVVLGKDPLFFHTWLNQRDLRGMEVSLCDEKGAPVLAWKVAFAVPVGVKAPAFVASSNEPALESVELQVRGISLVRI